jgi:hypothetical protein
MKFKFLFVFLLVSVFIQAQDLSYDNDVKHFIEINGTMGQYRNAVNQLVSLLKDQYKNANVTDDVWNETQTMAINSLSGLSDDLVVIYKKFFTHDEIKELNLLYENKVAQKFINNVGHLTEASQDPSIVWSRSLYNQLTDMLHQKGYTQ